jgi:hypothetical protein
VAFVALDVVGVARLGALVGLVATLTAVAAGEAILAGNGAWERC